MEDKYTEYKLRYSHQIEYAICSFLNTDGGKVHIGFDENGELVGVDNLSETKAYIEKLVNNKFPIFKDNIEIECSNSTGRDFVIISITKADKEQSGYAYLTNKSGQKDYYFRLGDRNFRTDEEHAPYWEIMGLYDFPINDDYEPSDREKKKNFTLLKKQNNVTYKQIGQLRKGNYLYKYMDLESALRSLEKKKAIQGEREEKRPNLRFVEPTSWDDQYEGRFYNAVYNGKELDAKTAPFLYACCFSSKRENEAAWILYSHNRTGLASRCVEFTLNRFKLREQLVRNLKDCSLYIGMVNYQSKEIIDNLHLLYLDDDHNEENRYYHKYFDYFTIERYLDLLLLKRTAFEHEQEVRIFIIPYSEVGNKKARRQKDGKFPKEIFPQSKFVDIDWIDVIENVKIDKNCTTYEETLLQDALNILVEEKKDNMGSEEYDKLKTKFQLRRFDPYEDDSLERGPLQIETKNPK